MHLNFSVLKNILLFLFTLQGSLCLRNVEFVVPESVQRGSRVEMKCDYDLEQEVLYTVKWYRGDREFCRYSPRDVPPIKIFPIPGIDVETEATHAHKLTIYATGRNANGRYTCEITAEEPSFQTARVSAHMNVVDFPNPMPELLGLNMYYRVGSQLKVECNSLNSMPPANITFFINSKRIRCGVNIYNIYFRSNEHCALEEKIPTTPDPSATPYYPKRRLPKKDKKITTKKNCADSYHGSVFSVSLLTLWHMAYLTNIN